MISGNRISLDTNILIYALDSDAGKRHKAAQKIIERLTELDAFLSLQALSEFFYAVTRKKIISYKLALEQVQDWQILFPTIVAKPTTLNRAIKALDNYNLSFWDAMLWATVRDANINILLSEDMQHGQLIEGVRIVNPFIVEDFLAPDLI